MGRSKNKNTQGCNKNMDKRELSKISCIVGCSTVSGSFMTKIYFVLIRVCTPCSASGSLQAWRTVRLLKQQDTLTSSPCLHQPVFTWSCECSVFHILNLHFVRMSNTVLSQSLPQFDQVNKISWGGDRCIHKQWEYMFHVWLNLKGTYEVLCFHCLQDSPNYHHQLLPGKAPGERGRPAERPERKSSLHQPWCIKQWVEKRICSFLKDN